jgi:hypothetical protein
MLSFRSVVFRTEEFVVSLDVELQEGILRNERLL